MHEGMHKGMSNDVVGLFRKPLPRRDRAGALVATGLPTSDQCSINGVL